MPTPALPSTQPRPQLPPTPSLRRPTQLRLLPQLLLDTLCPPSPSAPASQLSLSRPTPSGPRPLLCPLVSSPFPPTALSHPTLLPLPQPPTVLPDSRPPSASLPSPPSLPSSSKRLARPASRWSRNGNGYRPRGMWWINGENLDVSLSDSGPGRVLLARI